MTSADVVFLSPLVFPPPEGPLRAVNHLVGHHHPSPVAPIDHGYPTWEYVSRHDTKKWCFCSLGCGEKGKFGEKQEIGWDMLDLYKSQGF